MLIIKGKNYKSKFLSDFVIHNKDNVLYFNTDNVNISDSDYSISYIVDKEEFVRYVLKVLENNNISFIQYLVIYTNLLENDINLYKEIIEYLEKQQYIVCGIITCK